MLPYLDPGRVKVLGRIFFGAFLMLIGPILFAAQCHYPHAYSGTVHTDT